MTDDVGDKLQPVPKVVEIPKPARLAEIMTAMGRPHADVLHVVAAKGVEGATVRDVQNALSCSRNRANGLIEFLETAGFVYGVPARGERVPPRPGQPVRFFIAHAELQRAIDRYRAHILGAPIE